MQRRSFLSQSMPYVFFGAVGCSSGCGTIFHSERIGQPHSRDIDWKVAALNGLGLLFFFVPGVVAFAVDFYTGAIYLPPEYLPYEPNDGFPPPPEYTPPADFVPPPHAPLPQAAPLSEAGTPSLHCLTIAREDLHPQGIRAAVEKHLGKTVNLEQTASRVTELDRLEDFDQTRQFCQSNPRFGTAARQFFQERISKRRWSA